MAFTYGRRDIGADLTAYDGDLRAGDLSLICESPFKHWRVDYDGPAQDIPDAAILLERRKARPDNWYKPARLVMSVDFRATSSPHYAASGERGHFEQTGRVTGTIAIDGERFAVDGYGVRDKSWGPRDWGAGGTGAPTTPAVGDQPAPFVNWFSMNFGADLALGGSCIRHADGAMRGAGWYHAGGQTEDLLDVVITSAYRPGSIWHTAVHLTARTVSGKSVDITGKVLTVCPTKIPMRGGATFVNEGLAEFTMDGRTGYGIAEHWHAVRGGE
ncbi:MAG: hypothetical protein R3E84_19430 [Pseudomonadales bacterium]